MAAVTSSEKWCGCCRCLCPDRGRAAAALSRKGQDGFRLAYETGVGSDRGVTQEAGRAAAAASSRRGIAAIASSQLGAGGVRALDGRGASSKGKTAAAAVASPKRRLGSGGRGLVQEWASCGYRFVREGAVDTAAVFSERELGGG